MNLRELKNVLLSFPCRFSEDHFEGQHFWLKRPSGFILTVCDITYIIPISNGMSNVSTPLLILKTLARFKKIIQDFNSAVIMLLISYNFWMISFFNYPVCLPVLLVVEENPSCSYLAFDIFCYDRNYQRHIENRIQDHLSLILLRKTNFHLF